MPGTCKKQNFCFTFYLICKKGQIAIVISLMLALVSHFKVLHQSFFRLWARHCQASYPVQGQVLFDGATIRGIIVIDLCRWYGHCFVATLDTRDMTSVNYMYAAFYFVSTAKQCFSWKAK